MTTPPQNAERNILQHMATINHLCLKAVSAETKESLIFIILNDTVLAVRYDRALLWDISGSKAKILGVSGQTEVNKDAKITKQWEAITEQIADPKIAQRLENKNLKDNGEALREYAIENPSNIIWLPIFIGEEPALGLWIEGFGDRFQEGNIDDTLKFLMQFLIPSYSVGWKKFYRPHILKKVNLGKEQLAIIGVALLLFLFIARVPLRIVAPCEIVASEPFVITAPLEGIVEKVEVTPGQVVKKGDILYEYNKQLATRNLNVSQKQVQVLEEGVKRARTLGLSDPKSLTELSLLTLKLEKEKVNLNYVQWQTTQLTQEAPVEGIIIMENPDQWRGKPVKIGEKIMTLNDPNHTKIKIWIPEDDNVILDPDKPIKIILNIDPAQSYNAHLLYIANESSLSELHIPSFVAEAVWVTIPPDNKLGLKGTAILYGEKVSLFYYLIRKPLGSVRNRLGI